MKIRKSPLRRGLSFPLRASKLETAIVKAAIKTPVTLYQRSETWWTTGVLFRGDFYPPGRHNVYSPGVFEDNEAELVRVTCRSVPSHERSAAVGFLEETVLPAFIKWLATIEALPEYSTVRREKQSFAVEWPDNG
jgi:hypothetical protein